MQPILYDSSVYIAAFQGRPEMAAGRYPVQDAPVWLSSVVLEELYAGAGLRERRAVERLERDFAGVRRILVPNLTDWTLTGKVLAQVAARHGYEAIGRGRLTNDALIAMSAGRHGISLITANKRDFAKLAEFRPFSWRVMATA